MTASAPPPRHVAASEALRFLQSWFARCPSGQLLEVRPLHRGGRPLARTWCASVDEAFESAGDYVRHGDDVYIGALPRVRRGGKPRTSAGASGSGGTSTTAPSVTRSSPRTRRATRPSRQSTPSGSPHAARRYGWRVPSLVRASRRAFAEEWARRDLWARTRPARRRERARCPAHPPRRRHAQLQGGPAPSRRAPARHRRRLSDRKRSSRFGPSCRSHHRTSPRRRQ